MYTFHPKMNLSLLCAILVLFSTSFIGCGDSQGVKALNAQLSEFSELIENYEATVAQDKSKKAELDARIEAMSVKWAKIRNEFGSDITPQKMDELVKQYEKLMLTLAKIKKTIGS